jgi:hypothetical protein
MELFSLRKSRRICPRCGGPSPQNRLTGSTGLIKYQPLIQRSAVMIYQIEPFFLASNLGHRWFVGRLRLNGEGGGGRRTERNGAIAETTGENLSQALELQLQS